MTQHLHKVKDLIPAPKDGNDGNDGNDGKDAPVLNIQPSVILYDADSDGKAVGQNLVFPIVPSMTVNDETIYWPNLNYTVTTITNVTFTDPTSRPRQAGKLTVAQGTVAEGDVKIEALGQIGQEYYTATGYIHIAPNKKGEKGEKGPALRGPQLYSDVPSNFQFMEGAAGEEFLDIVIDDNGNFYKCKQTHVKSSGVAPGATGWETYWSLGTKFDIVATQILLATYALIKNLGVENVEAKDANNNTIFSVRNGILVCNGGTIGGFKISSSRIGAEDVDPNNFLWIDSTGKIRIVRTGTGNALDILGNILLNGNGGTFTLNNASNNGTIKFLGRLNVDTGYLKTSSDSRSVGDIYRDANGFLKIQT